MKFKDYIQQSGARSHTNQRRWKADPRISRKGPILLDHFPLPRRTVRLRLTLLYSCLFLAWGIGLLAITYLLVAHHIAGPFSVATGSVSHPTSPSGLPPGISSSSISELLRAQVEADLNQFLVQSGIALAIMALVAIVLGWGAAGRILQPLRHMTATTRQISEENLHKRLALSGPSDELKDLSDTIDELLERLEASFEAQRRFVTNAAHELRTPLTMMRTSLDVAVGKPDPIPSEVHILAGKLREGLDQADRLVESFLVLARAQRGILTNLTHVSLPQLVSATLTSRSDTIAARSLQIQQKRGAATVIGSETLLARLVENLVDNAIRYSMPGGFIGITTEDNGTAACLVVENDGPHLDEDKVQELGRPFRRLGAERTTSEHGFGLGLSIVAAISAAHGGSLDLQARPKGGLQVVIMLPHTRKERTTGGLR